MTDLNKRVWPMDGSEFKPNDHNKMSSPNGEYYLVFKNDGNLVMYKEGGVKRWASNNSTIHPYALNTATSLVFQKDGNMVIYDKDGKALWASYTILFEAINSKNVIMSDLNKRVWPMDGSEFKPNDHNKMYSPNGEYYLVFQNDGNLVMYKEGGVKRWASNDSTKYKYALNTATSLVFQTDGNLVIYDKDGKALWASGTNEMVFADGDYKGKSLNLSNEGRLFIFVKNKEDLVDNFWMVK